MRTPRLGTLGATALLGCALLAGCTSKPPVLPDETPTASPVPTVPTDPWSQLAARVAAAQDNRYVATYTLQKAGRPARTIGVTIATDDSWQVTVPGGALGGSLDVAVAQTKAGLFLCTLGPTAGCYRVGDRDTMPPVRSDPRVEHVFTDWLDTLGDRSTAIAVEAAPAVPGGAATGTCFAVGPNSAALPMPVDPGSYCYDAKGTLTAAALSFGTLTLASGPAPAPASITLPGPVVPGTPPATAAPPSPSPSVSRH